MIAGEWWIPGEKKIFIPIPAKPITLAYKLVIDSSEGYYKGERVWVSSFEDQMSGIVFKDGNVWKILNGQDGSEVPARDHSGVE